MTSTDTTDGFSGPLRELHFDDYVPEEDILTFARQFDPQMIHTDPVAAAAGAAAG